MANLLSWLGKTVKDVEKNVGNFIGGAERGVQRNIVNPVVRQAQQAPQQITRAVSQAPQQIVRSLPVINQVANINDSLTNAYKSLPKIQQQQVNQKLQQASNTIKPISQFAEGSNQSFLAGGGRDLTNLAALGTKISPLNLAVDALTHGQGTKMIDQASKNVKQTFFPEAGKKNSLSPTELKDYNNTMKAGRLVGSLQKAGSEQAALAALSGGAGNLATTGAEALPLGEGIVSQVIPRVAGGVASGASFGGLQAGLDGKSVPEAIKQAAGWGVAGGAGAAVLPLVPNLGNIPIIKSVPRALTGAGLGAVTAPLAGMTPLEGAAFGLLGGSEKPYVSSNVKTTKAVDNAVSGTLRKPNGQFNGSTAIERPTTKKSILPEIPQITEARAKQVELNNQRSALLQQGFPENHPALKANDRAFQDITNQIQSMKQGGYIGLPGTKKSGFATSVAKSQEVSPELQGKVKAQDVTYTPVTNKDQLAASEALIKKGYKKAATQVNERLDTKLGTVDNQTVSDTIAAIKKLDSKGGDANHALATDLTEKLAAHLTKAGQSVQAASLLNNRTPEGLLYGARKVLKKAGVEITPEMNKQFKAMTDKISGLKGEEKDYALAELSQTVAKYIPSSFKDKAVSLWKAGLLTGLKTQTGNALSNVTSIGLKTASNPGAAAIDKLISLATGERTKTFTLRGDLSGAKEGIGKGIKSLRTGIDERDISRLKFDTKQVNFGKSPAGRAAQVYVDKVFGLMSAADKPYYYSQLRNNLQDMAGAAAKNAKVSGAAKTAFIADFLKNPPQKAFETATKAAEKSVFANDTLLSKSAAGVRNSLKDHKIASAVADVIMPFTKVPSAVITRLFDYTPVGAVKTVVQQAGKGKFDQRALAEGLAEAGTGTGVIAIGYALAHGGLMTGSYPTDKKEQELWKLEGKQANSIKIGGKWQSVNYTSPAGQVLAIGQQIADAQKQGASALEATGAAGAGAAQAVLGQSFLQGVQGALDAVSDPQRNAARVVRSQAGSVVPTLVGDIAKSLDPLQRQTNSALDAVRSRIPLVNQTLLPKQDAFGDPLKRASSSINTLVNPFRPSDTKESTPLTSELRRLQDAGSGVMPDTTDKTLTFGSGKDKQTIKLTPQDLYDKNSKVGSQVRDIWDKVIKEPGYQNLDDAAKQAALKRALTDINTASGRAIASKNNVPLKSSASGNVSTYLQGGQPSAGSYVNKASGTASNPKDRYQQALDKYNQDKKDGKISDVKDVSEQSKLTRLKAQSNFSQDANDLYSQSFKNIVSFVNSNKNGAKLWEEVKALDKSMTDAGYTSKLYNKNGSLKATVAKSSGRKSTGAKKGRKATKGKVAKLPNFKIIGKPVAYKKVGAPKAKLPVSKLPKIKINKLIA